MRKIIRDPLVFRFLLAYWLYIDGIGTLQQMAVDFGGNVGLPAVRADRCVAAGAVHLVPGGDPVRTHR